MSQVITQIPKNTTLSGFAHFASGTISSIKSNLSATTDPNTNTDSASGYAIGSIWINTSLDKIFQCVDASVGAAVWNNLGTSTPVKLIDSVVLAFHGFSEGDVIRKTLGSYVKSQADNETNGSVVGVVESVIDPNNFTVVYSGKLAKVGHGFGIGSTLYLSQSTAGLLTATAPSTGIKKPVAIVTDANSFIVLNSALVVNLLDNTVREMITQSTHGFVAGEVLRHNGTIYVKAQGTVGNSAAIGVVESVVDVNNFFIVYSGRLTTTGRTAGAEYFLDETTAGAVTTSAPVSVGSVQRSIYTATSTTSVVVNISPIGIIQ